MDAVRQERAYQRLLIQLIAGLGRYQMVGVEVGVSVGKTSARLLQRFAGLTLWMVDFWAESPADSPYRKTGDKRSRLTLAQQLARMEVAEAETEFAAERRILRRQKSTDAAAEFPGLADFVFIDASHAEADVAADVEAWFPLVKQGGLFAGHDYSLTNAKFFGVKRAVDAFAKAHKRKINVDTDTSIWWVRK